MLNIKRGFSGPLAALGDHIADTVPPILKPFNRSEMKRWFVSMLTCQGGTGPAAEQFERGDFQEDDAAGFAASQKDECED